MAGAREVRRRIRSVRSIGQITKAMELVAASKMRRAQEVAMAGRRYSLTITQILGRILPQIDQGHHPFLRGLETSHQERPVLVLVFGPDKGLCGGLITNLLREVVRFAKDHPRATYLTMGRRMRDGIIRFGGTVEADFPLHDKPRLGDVLPMTKMAMDQFQAGEVEEVLIANTRFISTLKQEPRIHRLLPLSPEMVEQIAGVTEKRVGVDDESEFKFEPNIEMVLQQLLPRFIEMTVFQALLEALASEHSARMIAMKNAGDNAKDLQDELTLTYNQLRQAMITAELAEIASATNG